jgi:PAS domain S-box-containing protein
MTKRQIGKEDTLLVKERDEPDRQSHTLKPSKSDTYRLATSELRYRRLFETAQDGILILSAETAEINEVNPFLIDMLGYSKEEFVGKKLWDIGAFSNIKLAKVAFEKLQHEHYIRYEDMPLRTKNGALISVEFVSNVYQVGNANVIQCNIRDITERKIAEQAKQTAEDRLKTIIEISELHYRRLFETTQDGRLILDAETAEVTDVNPFLINMLGYSKEEFLGKKLWELGFFKNSDLAKEAFKELKKKKYIRYEDLPLETIDGRQILVEFISNVYDVDNLTVIQCNIRDIAVRKEAAEALLQNQRQQIQIRDQFLSRMSHELRSPLTPIHQFVTILLDGLAGDITKEQREYLTITLNNVNMLRKMVRDLLEVTRAVAGKLEVDLRCLYLTEFLLQIAKTYQITNSKEIELSIDIPPDLPPVYADLNRMRQIIDNLLENAIKFTPAKGRISIKAEVLDESPEFVRIAVTDTGCGISPEEHGKIFNYLYQVENTTEQNHRGLGIGLYICGELVASHGGRIWVESQLGQGSTFFFTIPVFSMESQIAAILNTPHLLTDFITIFTVELSHADKHPLQRKSDQTVLWEAWNTIQSTNLLGGAALMPRVFCNGFREIFFLVTCTNQNDAQLLSEQISKRLEGCMGLQDAGIAMDVSFVALNIPLNINKNISTKLLMNITRNIQDFMKTALDNGVIQ